TATWIALTATADERVRKDVVSQLQLKDPTVLISSFDRPNIHYSITPREGNGQKQLLAWLKQNHAQDTGIVYCAKQKDVEKVTQFLDQEGFNAYGYHGGMAALARSKHQKRFEHEDPVVMVATLAFGMG